MAIKDDASRGSHHQHPVSPLASPSTIAPAASLAASGPAAGSSSPTGTGAGDAGGHTASTGTGTAATAAATAESSRTRRGLDRLSGGLRELGFEVLSRKQRHEREKSSSSNKSLQPLSGPRSPDLKTSPPFSRTPTTESLVAPSSSSSSGIPADTASPSASASVRPTTASSSEHRSAAGGAGGGAAPSGAGIGIGTEGLGSPQPSSSSSGTPVTELSRRPAQAHHHSGSASNSGGSSSRPGPSSAASSMKKPTFVLVTQDHEQLSRVDLNGVQSSAAIRERLYTKAHIPDDDFSHCTVHLSSLEQGDPGTPLDDSELWQISQGVLSGEITPAPLFFVQLAVSGTPSSGQSSVSPHLPPSHHAGYARTGDRRAGAAEAGSDFHPPRSPHSGSYPPPPLSNQSDSHRERYNQHQQYAQRPDSLVETSSNSSLSRPRGYGSQQQGRRSSPQESPSLVSNEPAYSEYHSQGSGYPHQRSDPAQQPQRQSSYHSPPLDRQPPNPPFFDDDRRSSGGSLHPPTDYREQSSSQRSPWDRRSSAGSSSDQQSHPEFLERPGHLRRGDRQARTEAPVRSTWDDRQQQQQPYPNMPLRQQQYPSTSGSHSNAQASLGPQLMGVGPSGPIYRPRANSATNQDGGRAPMATAKAPASRNAPPPSLGPSGFLHFPQPSHHQGMSGSASGSGYGAPPIRHAQPPPTIFEHVQQQYQPHEHPQGLTPGSQPGIPPTSGLGVRGIHMAKSMDNLRSAGPASQPPALPPRSGAVMPSHMPNASAQRQQGYPGTSSANGRIYDDIARRPSPVGQTGRSSGHEASGSRQPSRGPSQQSFNSQLSPVTSNHLRSPPLNNTSPRVPSYPPYVQRPASASGYHQQQQQQSPFPSPHFDSNNARQYHQQQQQGRPSYPPSTSANRRPSFEMLGQQRPVVMSPALQSVGGPQRLPLHPGETLQDALGHRQQGQQQDRHFPGGFAEPSQDLHNMHARQGRAASYEQRPYSAFSPAEAQMPQYHSQQRFAEDVPFTSSPPAQYSEQQGPGNSRGQGEENSLAYFQGASQSAQSAGRNDHRQHQLDYVQTHRPPSNPSHVSQTSAHHSPPMQVSLSFDKQSSARSSSSSIEHHQRSPGSSRPSTSSDGPFSDRAAAERPPSFSSSNSTTELATPSSDHSLLPRIPALQRVPEAGEKATTDNAKVSNVVHQGDTASADDIYQGVEVLRGSIDAATEDTPDIPKDSNGPAPAVTGKGASGPPYLTADADISDDAKAREWANLFVGLPNSSVGSNDDEDTLGKKHYGPKQHLASGDSDEESSTLGKTAAPPRSTDGAQNTTHLVERSASQATEKPSATSQVPTPAFSYNPDEDDDDEVMTWAVQMQPTKAPANAASTTEPKVIAIPSETPSSAARQAPPKHIALPAAGFEQSPLSSPRHEKPSLRVQTDMQKQQQALASRNVIKAGVSAPSPAIEKRSASPRSAISRRPRQTSKDIPSAIDEGNSRPGSRGGSASGKTAPAADASTSSANPDSERGNPMNRRASFSNNAWLYRPPVEQVYDNLEEYFPGHDLDKPIVDAGISGPGSAVSSPALDSAGPSPAMPRFDPTSPIHEEPELMQPQQPAKESKPEKELFRRFNSNRKSIRMVAQDRKSKLKKEESAARSLIMGAKDEIKEKLARRKSTKVWGRKIEEVTSAEAEALSSAKEPVSADKEELAPIKWVKGELIGKGTYGHVYIGFNVTNGEMVAVKQVELPRTASDKDDTRQLSVVEALKSEIELLKDLEHEKIVSYLGFEESRSHLSIFLEYVPGGSVGRCLRKHGKFEEHVIQFFTVQILEGLEYLHSRGILHRDLKADNILVKMDGTVKISDFGISKKSNDIYNNNSNMSMQGSIFWMAPEVVHNQRKGYSAKIDIWSIGCVVLEMFAGRRPWDSEEAIQAMFKLGAERLAPPIPKDVILSNQSSHFLKECFHADPDRRPMASRLLCHKFLTLDKSWDWHTSALYKAMTS